MRPEGLSLLQESHPEDTGPASDPVGAVKQASSFSFKNFINIVEQYRIRCCCPTSYDGLHAARPCSSVQVGEVLRAPKCRSRPTRPPCAYRSGRRLTAGPSCAAGKTSARQGSGPGPGTSPMPGSSNKLIATVLCRATDKQPHQRRWNVPRAARRSNGWTVRTLVSSSLETVVRAVACQRHRPCAGEPADRSSSKPLVVQLFKSRWQGRINESDADINKYLRQKPIELWGENC